MKERHHTPRRTSTFLPAALISLLTTLLLAPTALADQPWEYPDRDGLNRRGSVDAPPRSIGSADRLGPTKRPVWKRSFDADITGTPIAARNGGIYVGDRGGVLHALIYSNGRTYCSQNVGSVGAGSQPSPITGSALYLDEKQTVYVVANKPGRPRLVALHPITCDIKWVSDPIDTQLNWEASDPTYSPKHNLIFVGTCVCTAAENGSSGVGGRGSVVAINADTGALVWKTYTVAPAFNGGAVAGTPIPGDPLDRVYVATDHAFVGGVADPNTDAVLALDEATGSIVGSFQARENDIATVSNLDPSKRLGFGASPIGFNAGGRILIGAGDKGGTFYALDPQSMELVFKTDVVPGDSNLGRISGLAVDPKTHNIHGVTESPATFFGLSRSDGSLLYSQPATAPTQGPPSVANSAVWSADDTGMLDLQDVATGRGIGRLVLGTPSIGGVSFFKKQAYVAIGTGNGTGGGVVAFK